MNTLKNFDRIIYCLIFTFCCSKLFPQHYNAQQIDTLLIKTNEELRTRLSNKDLIIWNQKIIQSAIQNKYPKGEAWGYANIANRLWLIGEFKKAIEYLNYAEEKSKKLNDDFLTGKIIQEYSQVYNRMNLPKMALDYNLKAMKYALRLKKDNQDCRFFLRYVYSTRSVYFDGIKQHDSSFAYLHKAMKIDPNPLDVSHIASHYTKYNWNPDSANSYFKKAFDLLETQRFKHNKYQRAAALYDYGIFMQVQKKNNEAIDAFTQSVKLAKEVDRPQLVLNDYRSLASVYKALKKTDKEVEYLNKASSLNDSIDNNLSSAITLSFNKITKEDEEEKKKTKHQAALWYGGGSSVIVIVLSLYFYLQIRRKKKKLVESKKIILQQEEETKTLKRKLSENHEQILQLAKKNSVGFLSLFQKTYPEVCQQLLKINPRLSHSDLSFCAMIWLGFSSKEIAQYSSMEHRSVQTKKYRLRKKLYLDAESDLYQSLKSISETE
ncbi:tetratricopeptide repeat protein [Chryseobacterium indologenes]|uniref:Tetratricopeptide repeat protein n=1 Tax=Chryseobacterium indologenes TaxID=253 RepID=A0A411DR07_CHRID|nr:tetratricopeptide repeat protein [Chryseobacterium indologenes]